MITFPGCKINLGLYVTERRPDGFHNLETCFYPVPWCDVLEAIPSVSYSLTVTGTDLPASGDNLVTKAHRLLQEKYGIGPVSTHLHKCLPHGAGLGGGSADGAYMLVLLNKLFKLGLDKTTLESLAIHLGSDCPFFIEPTPKLATGKGEIFSPVELSLKGKFIVLVKPSASISTAEAYRHVQLARPSGSLKEILEKSPVDQWKDLLFNSFEPYAFQQIPQLTEIKSKLYNHGALFAMMSGSGSAVYGLFREAVEIDGFPDDCVVWQGQLG
ncbi:MAG: hypothetical protein RL161_106 [Bacteroidota bacterium]|jgi:4-diphosphocytidyl-2-C-methyl-D-erythritol kinase